MSQTIQLPVAGGVLETHTLNPEPLVPSAPGVPFNRVAFAAAHVVSDPLAECDPWIGPPAIDWDTTLAFRQHLYDLGLNLAEAMDTAQRGMGLDWPTARELIQRSLAMARTHPRQPRVVCGAGTDQLAPGELHSEAAIIAAYETQMAVIEAAGGECILMASRALTARGTDAAGYQRIYDRLISQAARPVVLHWLGAMFDPQLSGYWGSRDIPTATATVLAIIHRHASKVDGIKVSLLDLQHEVALRRRLPPGVKLYTGDDFNYVDLIQGDEQGYSDALLGVFAAIAPAASLGLAALAAGDVAGYRAVLEPTVPFARELFRVPTQFYKAGVAFVAWLNGQQGHFVMPGGLQSSRSILHYARLFRLADRAGLLQDPPRAAARMRLWLGVHGIDVV